jgi:hypothetical protein
MGSIHLLQRRILYAEGVKHRSPGSANDEVVSATLGPKTEKNSALKGLHTRRLLNPYRVLARLSLSPREARYARDPWATLLNAFGVWKDDSLVRNRTLSGAGLKGQNIPAQGNALGEGRKIKFSPERASQSLGSEPFVSPFQGSAGNLPQNPGRCLGLICDCPFGAKNVATGFLRTKQNAVKAKGDAPGQMTR